MVSARLAGEEATASGSTFKIKAAHREVTTGALLAWRGTMEPESTGAVQGWSCNVNSFPSSSVAASICGSSHLHGSMEPKIGQKKNLESHIEKGETQSTAKTSPTNLPRGWSAFPCGMVLLSFLRIYLHAHQPSVGSTPALQDPALCHWGSNKPRYSRVCWVKNPHMKQEMK